MSSDEDVTLDEIVDRQQEDEKQQIIEQNLQKMKFSRSKLLYAQECYYGSDGTSPLRRFNSSAKNDSIRQSVHSRLGKRFRFRTFPMNISTDTLLPKNRRGVILGINRNCRQWEVQKKCIRLFRSGQAQLRIERIRHQQAEALRNSQLIQPVGKFRLRRRRLNATPFQAIPTNYAVEVPNNMYMNNHVERSVHSIRDSLDVDLQNEIIRIQMVYTYPSERIVSLSHLHTTGITLDDRFSSLP